jgi:hypothetical protein
MIQTTVVVLLVVLDAILAQLNASVLGAHLTFTLPGAPTVHVTYLQIMAGVSAALALTWFAGMIDRHAIERRVEQRESALAAMQEELLRKAASYDREQPLLLEVRLRLEELGREMRALQTRRDWIIDPPEVEKAETRRPDRIG